jgi:TM2 domain-containing membrane protein YozV
MQQRGAAPSFGRKGHGSTSEMDARREAFIAAERARRQNEPDPDGLALDTPSGPIYVPQKSLGTAYVLWFVAGPLGAHRFYLGLASSGAVMIGLWVLSWVIMLQGMILEGMVGLCGVGLWVLVDAFLMPSLHRQLSQNARRAATGRAFA